MADTAKGFVIAAPQSGSGKTMVTLGLCRAFADRGLGVAPAKIGPDYIDPAFLALAAGETCINLDPWAMEAETLRGLAANHADGADMFIVEGVMGLFDGAADGAGSTADAAAALGLPVILVVDCGHMAQSLAALVTGFANFRADVQVAGVVLNKVASDRHEHMLRQALDGVGMLCLGAVRRNSGFAVSSRHLGLTLPGEIDAVELRIAEAANTMAKALDLDALQKIAMPLCDAEPATPLPPLGQHMAIARDAAFAFIYDHHLRGWREAGAELSFFSPLADEAPDEHADAVFLPGGYPELHGPALAVAGTFKQALANAKDRGALIYGECGGFMVLGQCLTDKAGNSHQMAGLLPLESHIDQPKRVLGYRQLAHKSALPWPHHLKGHEFHYSTASPTNLPPLFEATDALGVHLPALGAVDGRVMGSYAHVIGAANG